MKLEKLNDIIVGAKLEDLKKAISENQNPYELLITINEGLKNKISPYLIQKYILQNFKKVWKKKKWQDVTDDNDIKDTNVVNEDTENIVPLPSEDTDSGSTTYSSENNPPDDANNLETILKKLYHIETKIKEIEKSLKSLNNSIYSLLNNYNHQIEDFVGIYSSESIKVTLNLNKKIKEELKSLLEQNYKIKNNDSKLINTALLIALLNEKNKRD
ncbi:hypothetical protein [Thermobrachium celere]|uniref:Uncharacterized protein n=1 Tax=Thermobrachium celere DSM 8682 TaxID=941824 RepID=R7RSD1_9CLOT|nr:hypothetical protein [Thermobrachium celere]CDF58296.1 hypothetical protein TCEL_00342 [Thermobrachium celere DSM 8682]